MGGGRRGAGTPPQDWPDGYEESRNMSLLNVSSGGGAKLDSEIWSTRGAGPARSPPRAREARLARDDPVQAPGPPAAEGPLPAVLPRGLAQEAASLFCGRAVELQSASAALLS